MKYLDASTGSRANKIFKGWDDLTNEFGVSRSDFEKKLLHLAEALAKKWKGRQIVMLVDEIFKKDLLNTLGDQSLPDSVRMILVLNPNAGGSPLTLPPPFLHVTLTTPYRSTIAITRLARFIAKCKGLVVPEGDFGSDVEGTKPIVFDIGKDERKMAKALEECHKQLLGDNATVLYYDSDSREQIENWMKAAGANWDSMSVNFYGWEEENVITAGGRVYLMEQITRAKNKLYILLLDDLVVGDSDYSKTKGYFQQAAEEGLVQMK